MRVFRVRRGVTPYPTLIVWSLTPPPVARVGNPHRPRAVDVDEISRAPVEDESSEVEGESLFSILENCEQLLVTRGDPSRDRG